MTIQQMLYALTVEECGSMNKASEKLYIVQPTLTSAIRELEKEIGITIFHRTHRGIIPTPEGQEFLEDIRNLYRYYGDVTRKYQGDGEYKRKFGVSTQHYSFAVKAFIELARRYDMNLFDLALRETETGTVIDDVGRLRSEVGVLFRSEFSRRMLDRRFREQELEFCPLVSCNAFVYLWREHPLASEAFIGIRQLEDYPRLSFEQQEEELFYAEEILSENDYPQTIKVSDRATMLNLMKELNGYTICSGIVSEEQNGEGYVTVPFHEDEENPNIIMEIGYIKKKNNVLSEMGTRYVEELKKYLSAYGV